MAFGPLVALLILAGRLPASSPASADPSPPATAPLALSQECGAAPGTVRVTFAWTPSRAGQQWLDLSLANNGFQPQTFAAAGPLPPQSATYTWDGLLSGAPHFARVNTLAPDGWAASQTLAFRTLRCSGA